MDRKELKKKITDLLKEFETVKVSDTKMGVLVEVFKGDDYIQATLRQTISLAKVCNYLSMGNLSTIDKRVAFKLISIIDVLDRNRIFILCHDKKE